LEGKENCNKEGIKKDGATPLLPSLGKGRGRRAWQKLVMDDEEIWGRMREKSVAEIGDE
jgi:hypothetical protein